MRILVSMLLLGFLVYPGYSWTSKNDEKIIVNDINGYRENVQLLATNMKIYHNNYSKNYYGHSSVPHHFFY